MARCERGYLCEVCGEEVADITDSDLYLRYVLGEIGGRELLSAPERHLRCNPTLAQFIVAAEFEPVLVAGPFAKAHLDPADVRRREQRVTAAYLRLRQVRELGLSIAEYPLPPAESDPAGATVDEGPHSSGR